MKFVKVMFSQMFVCPRGEGGLCLNPEGSLSRGVSVQGVSVQGSLCPGGLHPGWSLSRGVSVRDLCPGGVSVRGSLYKGSLSGGSLSRGPPVWLRAGGTHPTGMYSCLTIIMRKTMILSFLL